MSSILSDTKLQSKTCTIIDSTGANLYSLPSTYGDSGNYLTYSDSSVTWKSTVSILQRISGEIIMWNGYVVTDTYLQPTLTQDSTTDILDNWYVCNGATIVTTTGTVILPDMEDSVPVGAQSSVTNAELVVPAGNISITSSIPLMNHSHSLGNNNLGTFLKYDGGTLEVASSSETGMTSSGTIGAHWHTFGTAKTSGAFTGTDVRPKTNEKSQYVARDTHTHSLQISAGQSNASTAYPGEGHWISESVSDSGSSSHVHSINMTTNATNGTLSQYPTLKSSPNGTTTTTTTPGSVTSGDIFKYKKFHFIMYIDN